MLWVDKHRPLSLDKVDYHKDQATQLERLVRPDVGLEARAVRLTLRSLPPSRPRRVTFLTCCSTAPVAPAKRRA
jgi:hypothetical protein